ncbi:TonB-dependent receptor domain-containing protein [Capnocytophaga gingivalis]|uniref:TonB-dependent receptor n=1 Tax=Capnocytophaga gingivalis TaxID=1017 RepID=UPI0028F03BCD|nr:TonB-dependent receptor [Capnocytophaga gingivalis]
MKCFAIVLFFFFSWSYSQQQLLSGVVQDENKTPLLGVSIIDKNTKKWAITDEKGQFSLPFLEEYDLDIQLLGMEKKALKGKDTSITITLKEETLSLKEVVVTADKVKDKTSSAITLDKYAISQFQSLSLSDVLQQLPGQAIKNIDLTAPKSIQLRSALSSLNNAFGVGFIIDDMYISNDENMQSYGYTRIGGSNTAAFSHMNSSIDLRTIPAANIEKVEVISGIADAKYGNATSGLIIIERKAGASPLQLSASMVGGGNTINVQKGFKLPQKWGSLSLSLDYLNSNSDPRNDLMSFNRLSATGIWSTFNASQKLKNTLTLSTSRNLDGSKQYQELDEAFRNGSTKKEYSYSLSNRVSWQIDNSWIDLLSGSVSISYTKTDSSKESYVNGIGNVVPLADRTSFHQGVYTPVSYMSIERTIGEPLNISASVSASKTLSHGYFRHSLSGGTGFTYSDNIGEGKVFDSNSASIMTSLMPNRSGDSQQGVRPLNFNRYVIANKLFHFYLQDNISYTFNDHQSLLANIGLRYENQNGFSSLSPRINTAFVLSPSVKFRAGVGLSTKAPSLVNRFPGNVFFDILVKDLRTRDYAVNYIQTHVVERPEVSLLPAKAWKYEVGADFNLPFVRMNLTGFLNHNFDNFENTPHLGLYPIPELSFTNNPNPTLPPSYTITGYKDIVLEYQTIGNTKRSKDIGVELMMHFNKIEALNTQFTLSGSYVYSESDSTLPNREANANVADTEHKYIFYPRDINRADKLSLRLTTSYHLSFLGLLASLTIEQFTFSNAFASIKDIYPLGYLNDRLEYTEIPPSERTNNQYQALHRVTKEKNKDSRTPIYHNFHLRLTKELQNGLSLSFYINNVANYRPTIIINGSERRMNEDISFGATATFKFGKL